MDGLSIPNMMQDEQDQIQDRSLWIALCCELSCEFVTQETLLQERIWRRALATSVLVAREHLQSSQLAHCHRLRVG